MASEMVTDSVAPKLNGVDESQPPVEPASENVSSEAKALVNGYD